MSDFTLLCDVNALVLFQNIPLLVMLLPHKTISIIRTQSSGVSPLEVGLMNGGNLVRQYCVR